MAEKKDKIINFRISENELAQISANAKKAGARSIAQYLRVLGTHELCLNYNEETQRKMLILISRISSNVNQIAARINKTGNIYEEDIKEIKRGFEEIWQRQASILSMLQKLKP